MKLARAAALLPVLAATAALVACQRETPADPNAQASAAPEAKPGVSVTNGTLVLPAVRRNPGAAYFTLTNASPAPVTLAAVAIDGVGRTELHDSMAAGMTGGMAPLKALTLNGGERVSFARGGKHVMLFDVASSLQAGGRTEMTLTFAGGDKVSVPLSIEAVGSAPADHTDH